MCQLTSNVTQEGLGSVTPPASETQNRNNTIRWQSWDVEKIMCTIISQVMRLPFPRQHVFKEVFCWAFKSYTSNHINVIMTSTTFQYENACILNCHSVRNAEVGALIVQLQISTIKKWLKLTHCLIQGSACSAPICRCCCCSNIKRPGTRYWLSVEPRKCVFQFLLSFFSGALLLFVLLSSLGSSPVARRLYYCTPHLHTTIFLPRCSAKSWVRPFYTFQLSVQIWPWFQKFFKALQYPRRQIQLVEVWSQPAHLDSSELNMYESITIGLRIVQYHN